MFMKVEGLAIREAAMVDQPATDIDGPADHEASAYHRSLAAEIVAMLPKRREEAYGVLSLVVKILRLPVPSPSGEPETPSAP
jgi:hypothetical protein